MFTGGNGLELGIPEESISEPMDNCEAVCDSAKPIPKGYHIFRGRRRRHDPHEMFKIPSICIFQNDIIGVVVNETSVVGDDEG